MAEFAAPAAARQPRFVQLHREDRAAVRAELVQGLQASPAYTAPKFLYDALGSRLFDAITVLPEYYPTRTEAAIFDAHGAQIARALPAGATLIDLGAGSCEKAARLFAALQPRRYVAVDISADYLRGTLQCLQRQFPALDMVGVGLDFSASLALPPEAGAAHEGARVLFYPGSSIGNFRPPEALAFLRQCRAASGEDGALLIGVDLLKPAEVLEPAYDDALGVTAAFNLNLLNHLNALLAADFALADWRHVAFFDPAQSRVEMHLQTRRSLAVRWPGGVRRFDCGERIHTEDSYKWPLAGFDALLKRAGFSATQHWCDPQGWFAVFVADAAVPRG